MSNVESALAGRVAELRRAFDESFIAPVATHASATVDFISIRLGGDLHAVRMSAIGGLFANVRITPCPSPVSQLRGIAGFRGKLTPVYDLAAMIGYPMSSARWLVLAAGGDLALAFDEFDGHFRIEPTVVAAERPSATGHIHEVARQDGRAWPVIDIPSVVAAIRASAAAALSHKES